MTSLEAEAGREISMAEAAAALIQELRVSHTL
jgi:hypothetical protein